MMRKSSHADWNFIIVFFFGFIVAIALMATAFVVGVRYNESRKLQIPTVAVFASLTPSFTPTASQTLTSTPTTIPTQPLPTYTASYTSVPTATMTPFPTNTPVPTLAWTPSDTPTRPPKPTLDWRYAPTTTYYVTTQMANVRDCPSTQCRVLMQVIYRSALNVVEASMGEAVGGDGTWLHVNLGTTDGYVHNSVVSLVQPPPPTATPVPTVPPKRGTMNNPYPSGSWLQFEGGQVRTSQIVRPANSMVESFNMFNSPPAAGAEYVLVWFEVRCQQERCEPMADLDIRLIDSNGQVWGESLFEVLEPDLDMMEGIRGSTLAGWQLFEVPIGKGLSLFQIKWPKWISDPQYVRP